MEPNTGVLVAALIFLAVYVAIDRLASVKRDMSRDAADVEQKRADVEMFQDMSDKLVQTMQAMSGTGLANSAMRMAAATVIEPDERAANGRGSVPFTRENSQYPGVPAGFPQPRPAAEAGR